MDEEINEVQDRVLCYAATERAKCVIDPDYMRLFLIVLSLGNNVGKNKKFTFAILKGATSKMLS